MWPATVRGVSFCVLLGIIGAGPGSGAIEITYEMGTNRPVEFLDLGVDWGDGDGTAYYDVLVTWDVSFADLFGADPASYPLDSRLVAWEDLDRANAAIGALTGALSADGASPTTGTSYLDVPYTMPSFVRGRGVDLIAGPAGAVILVDTNLFTYYGTVGFTEWFELVPPVGAMNIHESATLGATGQVGGIEVSSNRFPGSRFSATEPLEVTAIGGHLSSTSGTLFGAIVTLADPNALPREGPAGPFHPGDVVLSAVFSAPVSSDEFRIPVSALLDPGDYALVFGSGEFGASGEGAMPGNDTDLPGASYLHWSDASGSWVDGGDCCTRFVVEAPWEPGIVSGLGIALTGLLVPRRKRR